MRIQKPLPKPDFIGKNLLSYTVGTREGLVKEICDLIQENREQVKPPISFEDFLPISEKGIVNIPDSTPQVPASIERIRTYLANNLPMPCPILSSYEDFLFFVNATRHDVRKFRVANVTTDYSTGNSNALETINVPTFLFPIVKYLNGMVAGGFLHNLARHRNPNEKFVPSANQDIDVFFLSLEDMEKAILKFSSYLDSLKKISVATFSLGRMTDFTVRSVTSYAATFELYVNSKMLNLQFIVPQRGEKTFEQVLANFDHHGVMVGWVKDGFLVSPHFDTAIEDDLFLLSSIPVGFPARLRARTQKYADKHCRIPNDQLMQLIGFAQKYMTDEFLDVERSSIPSIYGSPRLHNTAKDLYTDFLCDLGVLAYDENARSEVELLLYTITSDPAEMPNILINYKWNLFSRRNFFSSANASLVAPKRAWQAFMGSKEEIFPNPYSESSLTQF